MLPLRSWVGLIQMSPMLASIAVISLAGLWVRVWSRSHWPSPPVSSRNWVQLPVASKAQDWRNVGGGDGGLLGVEGAAGEGLELVEAVVRVRLVHVDAMGGGDRVLAVEAVAGAVVAVLDAHHVFGRVVVAPEEIDDPAEAVEAVVGVVAAAVGEVVADARLGVVDLDDGVEAEAGVFGQVGADRAFIVVGDELDAVQEVVRVVAGAGA